MKTNQIKEPRKVPRTGWKLPSHCLGCDTADSFDLQLVRSSQLIRGEETSYQTKKYVCTSCGAAVISPAQITQGVKDAIVAYQRKHDRLIGSTIADARKSAGLTSAEFAREAGCGQATIKRVEAGLTILSPSIEASVRKLIDSLGPSEVQFVTVLSESFVTDWHSFVEVVPAVCVHLAASCSSIVINGQKTDSYSEVTSLPLPSVA